MNPDRIVSDFKQRQLNTDLLEMSVVQNKPGENAISYKGKGFIRQTTDDILTFKLYANETFNTDVAAHFTRFNDIKSGQIYSDEDYYTLSGIAVDGAPWVAERVLPSCSWQFGNKNPIVQGMLSSICCGKLQPDPKTLALHFFDSAKLPVLIREAKFKGASCELSVEKGEDSFAIRANSGAPLPLHFAMRLEEAVQFLLAKSVYPRATVQPSCVVLTSATRKSSMANIEPPISSGSTAFYERSWGLFESYLDFVTRTTKFENWSLCSGYLHNAREASANSLDAWAIGLGVAVEGLANIINDEEDEERKKKRDFEKARLNELQDFIVEQVSKNENLNYFTKRVQGLVGMLTTVRAIDRLKWLVERGKIDPEHVDAWQRLRNRGVHPTRKSDIDVASLDFQKTIDELNRVTVLLYQIVFHLIDYRGPYTDYATQGFPTKEYPPALPTRPAPPHSHSSA